MGRGGESSPPTAAATSDLLGSAQFAPFLKPDFDAGEFASQALAGAHITAQAQTDQLQVAPLSSPRRCPAHCPHLVSGIHAWLKGRLTMSIVAISCVWR